MTTTVTAFERFIDHLRDANCRPKPGTGGWWNARCPAHPDHSPSLGVKPVAGTFIVRCLAGCARPSILGAFDMRDTDMWDEPLDRDRRGGDDDWLPCHRNGHGPTGHAKVAEYLYRNEHGTVMFGVTRCQAKCFAQWRPDPTSKSGRRWGIKDRDTGAWLVRPVPYRLPQALTAIQAGRNVWVTEGEKDADRLATLNIAAVCNNGGAGSRDGTRKWTAEHHATWLTGADVVIVADNDPPGFAHADFIVDTLLPVARSIEVVKAAAGKDISDHLDAGLNVGALIQVAAPLPGPTAVDGCPDCVSEGGG